MVEAEFDRADFMSSFVQVWKKVITDPQGFFLAMPLRGGLGNPLVFAVLNLAIAAVGFLLTGRGVKLGLILLVWGIVRLFIGAAILSLVARKLFDGKGDFEATFRVCAYAVAPAVVLWVPVVRYLAILYMGYLVIVGLQRAQEFDSVKAVLTLALSAIIGMVLALPFGGIRRI
jgi:hypothetical protein